MSFRGNPPDWEPPFMPPYGLPFGMGRQDFFFHLSQALQMVKYDAEKALNQNQYVTALGLYSNAIEMIKCNPPLIEDLPKMLCNRSLVLTKMHKYPEALEDARNCIITFPHWIKAYWRAAQAFKGMSLQYEALRYLINGINICIREDSPNEDYISFLAEIVTTIPQITDDIEGLLEEVPVPSPENLLRILQRLCREGHWEGVSLLVLGIHNGPISDLDELARNCPMQSLSVGSLVKNIKMSEMKKYGIKLAITMLKNGATFEDLEFKIGCPAIHIGINVALETDMVDLLKYLLSTYLTTPEKKDARDKDGDTGFHRLVKSGKINTQTGETILHLLKNYGCNPTIKDVCGKSPMQYLSNKDIAYNMLSMAEKNAVQKLEKEMSALKEEGNKAYKEQNYKKALESYTHALDLLLNNFQDFSKEAAILYSNRSMVYSGQNKNELALADAVDSVRICPSWNKGHWRRGQVLRSMGQHREAYSAFLEGFHKSEDISQDVKCNFLTEAAISFSNISEEVLMQRCYKGFEGVPIEFWSTVLGNLSKKGEWIAIRYLVLGMTDTDIGVARYANSIEVDFSKLFPFLYKEKPSAYTHMWLTDLVAILLHNGNTLLNFKEDDKDTPVHTAVKFSLLTGSTKILDDMPNVGGMNMIDKHGDSPFHVITKRRPTSDVKSMMRVAGVLIQKGFSLDILDRDRMLAVQYINPTGQFKQLYEMLIKVTKPPPMNFPGFPSAKFSVYPTENVGIQQLKEQGNKEFQNENWQRAAEFYTLAIDVGLRMRKGGHELAVLYSNRANCNLKLGLNTQALDDAVESVSHDGHWYKGHIRVGRAQNAMHKYEDAARAFANAFNTLEHTSSLNIKLDIISEFANVYIKLDQQKYNSQRKAQFLNNTSGEIWARVSYELICKDLQNPAQFAYHQLKLHDNLQSPIVVNLGPLCNLLKVGRWKWMIDLARIFVACGSDHKTIVVSSEDRYIHSVVRLTLASGCFELLEHIIPNILVPNQEQNLIDTKGNTALHVAARDRVADPPIRFRVTFLLLECEVDPLIRNSDGHVPLDYLPQNDFKIINLVIQFMSYKEEIDKEMKRQKKKQQKQAQEQERKQQEQERKQQEQERKQHEQRRKEEEQKRKQEQQRKQREKEQQKKQNEKQNSTGQQCGLNSAWQCQKCERTYQECADDIRNERRRLKYIYSDLVYVLKQNHKGEKHTEIQNKIVALLVQSIGNTLNPEIPERMVKIKEKLFYNILDGLAANEKWRQMVTLVQEHRRHHGEYSLRDFAKKVNIPKVIAHSTFRGSEPLLLETIANMLDSGAVLEKDGKLAVLAAIQEEHFKVLAELLRRGANPDLLTLTVGDTPVHAALSIALERDKGNFSILNMLLDLYEKDPQNYPSLNPQQQDQNGEGLFHLVARAKYNSNTQKATELLCDRKVSSAISNNENKLPFQYLNKNDRRLQFFRLAAVNADPKPVTSKKSRSKSSASKTSLEVAKSGDQSETGSVTEKTEGSLSEELQEPKEPVKMCDVVSKKDYVKTIPKKEAVKQTIEEMIFDLPEIPYSIFAPKKKRVEELDRSSTARAVKKEQEETPAPKVQVVNIEDDTKESELTDVVTCKESVDEEDVDDEEDDEMGDENFQKDVQVFDNLEWEVECTADVWKTLHDKKVIPELKHRVVRKIQLLASGEWRPYLCKKVIHDAPDTLKLYEAKLSKGSRIIWELAVAFSPRLSETAERRLQVDDKGEEKSSVKGGRIYSEVIRVWDITFDHDKIYRTVQKIVKSHNRGETCIIQKKLKGIKQTQFQAGANKRLPMIFAETDLEMNTETLKEYQRELQQYFPPASANETEYHILKFYSFSSNLVSHILQNIEMKVDFPFRVTDLEHAIINLQSNAPILLLGRSGTGKTTCCLYRLWSQFLSYWSKAKDADAPLLPRCIQFIPQGAPEEEEGSEAEQEENKVDDEEVDEMIAEECLNRNINEAIASESCDPSELQDDIEDPTAEENEDLANTGPIYDHLHQVFITKNAILCTELQKNFRELSHACDIAAQHVAMEDQALPNRLNEVVDFQFPLFVTSRQLLLMLDASLDQPYFFARNEDGGLKVDIQGWSDDGPLSILPFLEDDSDLEDEGEQGQFNDFVDDNDDNVTLLDAPGAIQRNQNSDPRREVTYDVFAEEVWPRISKKFSKKYHPSLIWTEIMSFIKGSFEALSKPDGYLSREEYKELGRKRAPNFSSERDNIYDIFKRYVHFKKQKFFFDETDLVYQVYNRLRTVTNLRWIVHQVFVDETQDFTQAELGLLMRICQNPNQMFLTGDTAQSIMRGIAFRFSDLKSLFYYASQSLQAVGKTSAIEVPKQVYQLTHNYRSHAGILSLASSILDLMVEFFPESFDRLEKDQGLFEGPAPVLLESCSFSDLALLLRGNKRKTSHIEFGAHQAILVVNNAARDNIPEELRLGLILTIYEAKGLEFDDILLYNFFKDSQASKEWRVVTDFLEKLAGTTQQHHQQQQQQQHSLVELDDDILQKSGRPRPLTFDPNQHKVLNSELKHLYTAVTRARVNVWIFDQDMEKRAPVFEYFKARKLVRSLSNPDNDQDLATEGMFAEESTPEEWNKRGDDFMKHNLYEVAAKCYNRGGDEHMEKVASAHQQALIASRIKDNPPRMREEFLHAAVKYLECQMPAKAAICLQNAREREFVAHIYEKIGQLERAGETYRKLKKPVQASNCFERLGKYNQAVEILHENEMYDLAIDTLRRYKMLLHDLETEKREIPQVLIENPPRKIYTEERLSYRSAEVYHSYKNESKMMAALERLPNPDDRLNFLKDKGYFLQASKLLQDQGRYDEAATLLLRHGKTVEAVELARQSRNKEIIGRCLLIDATLKFSKQSEVNGEWDTDDISKSLNEAKELLQNLDKDLLGDVYLLLGRVNGKEDDIGLSWGIYNKDWRNEAGQLECMDWMVNNAALNSYITLKKLVLGMENLLKVVKVLNIPETENEKSRAEKILAFYGLHKKYEEFCYLYPQQNPFGVKILERLLSEFNRNSVQCELLKEKVTIAVSRFLLQRGLDWYQVVIKTLESLQKKYSLCRFFELGKQCEVENCKKMHEHHMKKTYTDLLEFDMLKVELDSYIQKYCFQFVSKMNLELVSLVKKYLPQDDVLERFSSCQQLMLDLMPVHMHPKELSDIIPKFVQKFSRIRSVKLQFSDFLKCLYNDSLKKEPKDNSKIFVKIIFFLHLLHIDDIDVKDCMLTFESNIQKEFIHAYGENNAARKNVEKLGFMCNFHRDDRTQRHHLIVQCLPQRFRDAFHYLSTMNNDPLESLIKFTKFVVLLGDRNQMEFLPEIHQFSFWLEIYTTIGFCIAAKLFQDHDFFFVVPASYKSALTFVDYSFKDGIPTLEAIKRNRLPRNANISFIQDRIERMVSILCGSKVNLNLLWRMFNGKDNTDMRIAERLVILSMVFICNMGKSVWAQSEGILLQSLCRNELNDAMPRRLQLALENLRKASGICDIVCILQELLKERGDDLLFCKWDNTRRYGVCSEPLRKVTYFSSTFVNDDTLEMLTNPHKYTPPQSNDTDETNMDEDCQLSMEETIRRKKEQEKQEESEELKIKAGIILRKLKIIEFRKKCKFAAKLVKKQISREQFENRNKVFERTVIDENMCGICGVTFTNQKKEVEEVDVDNPEELQESESGGDVSPSMKVNLSPQQLKNNPFASLLDGVKPMFSLSKTSPLSEKQLHEQSADHSQKMVELHSFQSLYDKDIAPALEDVTYFISHYYIESDKASEYYSAMTLDITNLLFCKNKVESELQRILDKREWSTCGEIMMTAKEMVGHQNALKDYVAKQYKTLQLGKKSKKNKTAAAASNKNDLDDEFEDDITEFVVEGPVPRKAWQKVQSKTYRRHRRQED